MNRPGFLKRRYLINKPLQIKYALVIGGALFVMALLAQVHTYLTVEAILPNLFSSAIGRQVRSIQSWLLVNCAIYLGIVVFLSVFISHKIAGPLYRLETALREVLDSNDPAKRISLRKGDELQSLADLLNRLLERWAQTKK